jgi:beta-xylosidase
MKFFWFLAFSICLFFCKCNQKHETIKSGNPIIDGWYADPEVAVYENKYWIFPTFSARFEKQVFFDAFSSDDLVHWEKHSHILDSGSVKWIKKALWAPATIEKDGKYYLFFAANDVQSPVSPWWNPAKDKEGEIGGIGIGISDKPQGPYNDYLNRPLINKIYNKAQPIDQFVFKAENGAYYIVFGGWNHCNIARLNKDFTDLIPFEDGNLVKEITPEGYVEGPVMFMRNKKLYFMWSEGNWGDSTYKVAYAIANSPFGPFKRTGTVLGSDPKIATGAGHHSVLHIPGTDNWYIVYHRRPIPNLDRDHRVVCIDRMYFNEDGTIKPVKMTFEGVKQNRLSLK